MQTGGSVVDLRRRISSLEEKEVSTSQLQPNRWNFNEMTVEEMRSVIESIRRFGRIYPVIVRQLSEDSYEVIDGEHRWIAHRELGLEKIRIKNLGYVPDEIAQELTLILNETRGEPDVQKLSRLVNELVEKEGPEEVMKRLPYNPFQLRDLLQVGSMNLEKLDTEWRDRFPTRGVVSIRARMEKCEHEWEEVEGYQCQNCKLISDKIVEKT